MNRSRPRKFRIADALVLVAATAMAMVAIRYAAGISLFDPEVAGEQESFEVALLQASLFGNPVLVALAVVVVMMSLAGSGTTFRRLCRRPGFLSAVLVLSGLAWTALGFAINVVVTYRRAVPDQTPSPAEFVHLHYVNMMASVHHYAGWLILGAWAALAMGGYWRPSRDWTDRLGRLIGLASIGYLVVSGGYYTLKPLFAT